MKAPLLTYFGEPLATEDLKIALKKENSKIQLKGLVGSSFALTASAVVRKSSVPHLFIFRDKEEASYFINDIELLLNNDILFEPTRKTQIQNRLVPTSWVLTIAKKNFSVTTVPLNPHSWMPIRFPYWEGPISFTGSHNGVGYLEMTGY